MNAAMSKSVLSAALANYKSSFADDLARYECAWKKCTSKQLLEPAYGNSDETRAAVLKRLSIVVKACENAAVWLASQSEASDTLGTSVTKVESQFSIGFLTYQQGLTVLESLMCTACGGLGERSDAEPGDISFNRWTCQACKGTGAKL